MKAFAGFLALVVTALGWSQTVWVEAETPSNVAGAEIAPSGHRTGALSGDRWMTYAPEKEKIPAGGVTFTYNVSVPKDGEYAFWSRVGFEWVRADMAYRVDGGPWQPMPASQPTVNVVELGTWSEIAWLQGPSAHLRAGRRTIEVRFTLPEKSDRYLFGFDCFALVPEGVVWRPDNRLKPGEGYEETIDRSAAAKIYALPAPTGNGHRTEVTLSGAWQVARLDDPDMGKDTYEPIRALPNDLVWRGLNVPGDAWSQRVDLSFGHTLVYRTRVDIPAAHAGRSFHLNFGGLSWLASVFVNGKLAGTAQNTLVPFGIDITAGVVPGQTNLIEIAIKGSYYAMDGPLMRQRNQPRVDQFLQYAKWIDCTWPTGKGGGDTIQTGLMRPVLLVAAGRAYASDAYIRAKVQPKELTAELEFQNAGPATRAAVTVEAVNDATGQVEKRFADFTIELPANGTTRHTLRQSWPEAKLWWPAESISDKPTCYRLRTTLKVNGQAVDVRETLFGFRELGVDGRHVMINGVRWRPHTWNAIGTGTSSEALQNYFAFNDRGVRMEGGIHADFYDRNGIPGRLSMTWEGMFGQVAMENPRMWENWKRHVADMVRAYRNSPSVLHWSVGNEVQMITGRLFFGDKVGRHERQMKEVFDVAKRLDPTRTVSEDGAGDLGGLADSNNWHYVMNEYKTPRQFYEYAVGPASKQREGIDFQTMYRWDGNRPLVQGEEMYFAGMGNFAWFGGPSVYRGKPQRDAAGAKYGRMMTEGARWQDVFLTNPCTPPIPGIAPAMAARAVFVKEYNAAFHPGTAVRRTIKVFNDTRTDQTLELRWRLVQNGKTVDQGKKPYPLKAGMNQQDTLTVRVPASSAARVGGELVLELFGNGQRVFFDSKPFDVLPTLKAAPFRSGELAVWDPKGRVSTWLAARKQTMTPMASIQAIPATAKVVLVGPGAITEENRSGVALALKGFTASGRIAIVLEQSSPLREGDLPTPNIVVADREKGKAARPEWEKVGGHSGSIAHPMAKAHPVLRDISADDLFTWAGPEETNYRLSHGTPPTGTVNLVLAGEDLSLAPMFELLVGRGSYLISQMLIGEKLGVDPVADRLLQNALHWAAARGSARATKTVVYTGGDAVFGQFMGTLGLASTAVVDVKAALAPDVDVAVIRATPEALAALAQNAAAARAMFGRGGWIMLVGLGEAGLGAFNRFLGTKHRIRPFRKESVLLEAPDDALMMGISDRDLQQWDPEVIAPWMGLQRVSGKVFSASVDADENLAAFADLGPFREGANRPLTDGLTGETFWMYTQHLNANGSEAIEMKLDRPETLAAVDIWQSDAYLWAREIEVLADGKPLRKLTLKNAIGWQTVPLGVTATTVTIRVLNTYPPLRPDINPLVTIDEVRVRRKPLPGVVALTTAGGLVKYPLGKGGILLNQVRFDADDLPENLAKKKILFSSLLRNLGSTFRQ